METVAQNRAVPYSQTVVQLDNMPWCTVRHTMSHLQIWWCQNVWASKLCDSHQVWHQSNAYQWAKKTIKLSLTIGYLHTI